MQYLKEKENSLKDFLSKAEGQLKGIENRFNLPNTDTEEEDKAAGVASNDWMIVKDDS